MFTPSPLATYGDAQTLQTVSEAAWVDRARFTQEQQDTIAAFRTTLDSIVAAGPAEFGDDDVAAVLTGAAQAVSILATGVCDGFLTP